MLIDIILCIKHHGPQISWININRQKTVTICSKIMEWINEWLSKHVAITIMFMKLFELEKISYRISVIKAVKKKNHSCSMYNLVADIISCLPNI